MDNTNPVAAPKPVKYRPIPFACPQGPALRPPAALPVPVPATAGPSHCFPVKLRCRELARF
ncbi:protein of unknown function (plasmid) [Cupriavidus taiwanensis]|uniref:Uncharacterized protein n=1 Tax=Cupriavidus taiwanensis TaxID=164546 RepID=A0A375GLH6_9BURK|nr:protein of unknown function [Cupriavidus taiwanensis]SOZ11382.1 protein of unknown function [Cupriavidus taiwanensis]SOZ42735.1 protein of unknown function [Cupriavidus taiwanensis]SPC19944.1 hypothetical protein CT19431_MP70068 [Cupriavidus taiwanensis]SPC21922.1 protein of unknown function [Cupriavidus taiwanensis]